MNSKPLFVKIKDGLYKDQVAKVVNLYSPFPNSSMNYVTLRFRPYAASNGSITISKSLSAVISLNDYESGI